MAQIPVKIFRQQQIRKQYGRINIQDKRNFFDCGRFGVGTPKQHFIPELSGLELCIGIHRQRGKREVYAIMYRKDMWRENDVWRWWQNNKNKCTWFK